MSKQLISASKNWTSPGPEIDTYIPSLQDNANIEEALQLFMYGTIDNGTGYDDKSLYNFLTTFKAGIESNSTTIAGHTAQSNNVHNLGTAGPAGSDGGNIVGTSAQQTLTNKTLTDPVITLPASGSGLVPVGTIVMYGASASPVGWLICNGQSTAAYPALAAVVGATVPDLRGRVPMGHGDSPDAAAPSIYNTIGQKFGSESVTLDITQIPSHNHQYDASDGLGTVGRTHYMDRNNVHAHGGDYVGGTTYRVYGSTYAGAGAHSHSYQETSGGANDYNNNDGVNFGVDTQTGNQYTQYIGGGNHDHPTYVDYNSADINHRHTIQAQGGGLAHENRQPSTVVQFIIKH